jgi:hypothetical protein
MGGYLPSKYFYFIIKIKSTMTPDDITMIYFSTEFSAPTGIARSTLLACIEKSIEK